MPTPRKLMKLRLRPTTEKMVRVWSAMADVPSNTTVEAALRHGLLDLALARGPAFAEEFLAVWDHTQQRTDIAVLAGFGADPEAPGAGQRALPTDDEGAEWVICRFRIGADVGRSVAFYAEHAGERDYSFLDGLIRNKITILASRSGPAFWDAFAEAVAHAERKWQRPR